jgi:hypothetical protein
MATLTDILSALQNAVIANNNFGTQLQGSFNNISGQIAAITSSYVTSIAGNHGAFTLNATTGITNTVNDIELLQGSSVQFGAIKVDGAIITAAAGVITAATATSTRFGVVEVDGTTITAAGGIISAVTVSPSQITNSLTSDHLTNNTANYFDGPTIAQSTSGTWWVSGTVTVLDTASASTFYAKLWDGTTVIDSAGTTTQGANAPGSISLSGYISSPAANLKISVREPVITTGKILFNQTGNSKDSTISAFRIA